MKRISGGFTLIELLVVIAIIGLLSAVVLVSLNSARLRGKDTRVLNDVQQIRTDIESKFNGTDLSVTLTASNSSTASAAGLVAGAGSVEKQLTDDAVANGGKVFAITDSGPKKYAIYGQLVSNPAVYYCMASDGSTNLKSGTISTIAQLATNVPICQ